MPSPQVAGKQIKRLANEVLKVVHLHSAGEMGRRRNWSYFVKNLPHDHTLLELANECFDALKEEQRRQFLARCGRIK